MLFVIYVFNFCSFDLLLLYSSSSSSLGIYASVKCILNAITSVVFICTLYVHINYYKPFGHIFNPDIKNVCPWIFNSITQNVQRMHENASKTLVYIYWTFLHFKIISLFHFIRLEFSFIFCIVCNCVDVCVSIAFTHVQKF